jgi:hypothetical protein
MEVLYFPSERRQIVFRDSLNFISISDGRIYFPLKQLTVLSVTLFCIRVVMQRSIFQSQFPDTTGNMLRGVEMSATYFS